MYVANIAILELRILLQIMGFCFGLWKRLLLTLKSITQGVCSKVNDVKTFKNLAVLFYALWWQIICMYIADLLI